MTAHPSYQTYFQNKLNGLGGTATHTNVAYATMIKAMDDALGEVMGAIDDPNGDGDDSDSIADNTYLIFTSDHGGYINATNNNPLRGFKGQPWEGGHRVEMIVAGPGVQQSVVTPYQAISHDINPTVLEMTGVAGDAAYNAEVEGIGFKAVLEGTGPVERDGSLYWHFPHESVHGDVPYGVVVDGNWKLIQDYRDSSLELYDLELDESESTNLAVSNPSKTEPLRSQLHTWLQDTQTHLWSGSFQLDPGVLQGYALGDLDRNGLLNSIDWAMFQAGFGSDLSGLSDENAYLMGDLSFDGSSDHEDFVLFKSAYGEVNGALAFAAEIGAAAVPEPSSCVLLASVIALLGVRRCRCARAAGSRPHGGGNVAIDWIRRVTSSGKTGFLSQLLPSTYQCNRCKVVVASILSAFLPAVTFAQAATPPNVVILLADDMGYADVTAFGGQYGYTPNIDSLAASGTKMTQFYAGSAVCTPTRASILTGRYPLANGITFAFSDNAGQHLTPGVTTLPKLLKAQGYGTTHIGKWHLGGLNSSEINDRFNGAATTIPGPLQHGFDYYLANIEGQPPRQTLLQERRLYKDSGQYMVRNDDLNQPTDTDNWTKIKGNEALSQIDQHPCWRSALFPECLVRCTSHAIRNGPGRISACGRI